MNLNEDLFEKHYGKDHPYFQKFRKSLKLWPEFQSKLTFLLALIKILPEIIYTITIDGGSVSAKN